MLEADSTSDVLLPNPFSDPNQGKSYDGVLLIAYSRSFRVLEFLSIGWKIDAATAYIDFFFSFNLRMRSKSSKFQGSEQSMEESCSIKTSISKSIQTFRKKRIVDQSLGLPCSWNKEKILKSSHSIFMLEDEPFAKREHFTIRETYDIGYVDGSACVRRFYASAGTCLNQKYPIIAKILSCTMTTSTPKQRARKPQERVTTMCFTL